MWPSRYVRLSGSAPSNASAVPEQYRQGRAPFRYARRLGRAPSRANIFRGVRLPGRVPSPGACAGRHVPRPGRVSPEACDVQVAQCPDVCRPGHGPPGACRCNYAVDCKNKRKRRMQSGQNCKTGVFKANPEQFLFGWRKWQCVCRMNQQN